MSDEPMKRCLWVGLIFWGVWLRPGAFRIQRYELPTFGIGVAEIFA